MTQKFEFEGKQMTVRQIREIVTCLSDSTIRSHLKAGRHTRAAMLTYNPTIARCAGARRGAVTLQQKYWRMAGFAK